MNRREFLGTVGGVFAGLALLNPKPVISDETTGDYAEPTFAGVKTKDKFYLTLTRDEREVSFEVHEIAVWYDAPTIQSLESIDGWESYATARLLRYEMTISPAKQTPFPVLQPNNEPIQCNLHFNHFDSEFMAKLVSVNYRCTELLIDIELIET
jgi:hypothetical protein